MVVLYCILSILAVGIWAGANGYLSMRLHEMKGYSGGFWIGFLLPPIGLIYASGLPARTKEEKKKLEKIEKNIKSTSEPGVLDRELITYCKNCGNQIFEDEKKCSNCGSIKK